MGKLCNKNTMIIVSSPFQCICAIEAIKEFALKEYDFIVCCNNKKRLQQIKKLLKLFKMNATYIESYHYPQFILKTLISLGKSGFKKYDHIFCGDFKSPNLMTYISFHIKHKGILCYLDDGFTSIFPLNGLRFNDRKILFKLFIPNLLIRCKNVNAKNYFSIFSPGKTCEYVVRKNRLSVLGLSQRKTSHNTNETHGIFIIGTVVQFINSLMDNMEFITYFKVLVKYIRNAYPEQTIYYSPHARSIGEENLMKFCDENSIKIISSEYSVEIDYPLKGYSPKAIFAFGSTALVSLQILYPNADIKNIFLPANNKLYKEKNSMINKYLAMEGIKTIKLI